MPDEKLTEEEKKIMEEAFKGASISEAELLKLAEGEDESGESYTPVESEEDLVTAAASALEFVEGLDSSTTGIDDISDDGAVAGFDGLLKKLETLRGDISALQRGVVGVFAAQLLAFRGKVVELKSRISTEMVEKLRMQFFKSFIESTFVEIVDQEFSTLEKELVDKIVEQTQARFKEFATRVRESEMDLRRTIVEQQDVVRSFMQSLEEEALSQQDLLREKESEVRKLEDRIRKLQDKVDATPSAEAAAEELNRKISELETEVTGLQESIFKKDSTIEDRTVERDKAQSQLEELKIQLAETQTELKIYKEEKEKEEVKEEASTSEIKALESKIDLLEKSLSEKRDEADKLSKQIKDFERKMIEAQKDKVDAEESAAKRLAELESQHDRISEVKNLEEKVYNLEKELQETQEQIPIIEMQREAFEKATRLMEKERDMALEQRDLANERAKRYIKVLNIEANTKVLLLVDEVGSMSFADLGKSLGIPPGLAAKHARELEKLGVLRTDEEKAYSTLEDIEIEEGEVDVS